MRRSSLEEASPSTGGLNMETAPLQQSHSEGSAPAATSGNTRGAGAMTFLHTVKTVQRIQRMDKLMKAKSVRSLGSTGAAETFRSHSFLSERTPLTGGGGGGGMDVPAAVYQQHNNNNTQMEGVSEDLTKISEDEDLELEEYSLKAALYDIVFAGPVSVCLLAAPVALLAVKQDWGPIWIFWLNFIVMIPLASILGSFTEEVALHTNQTIGGLINATFGNAVEVVVAIQALLANEIRVVQSSMLGSIFSNLLLVLGCCFFFGGLYHKEQSFNSTAATANMGLLALSSIALVLPTPFAEYYQIQDEHSLLISRVSAIFLMFMYVQSLIFQLSTHAHLFEDDSGSQGELAQMPMSVAICGLLVTTLLITFFSEFLVHSIEGFTEESGVSRTFVGLILLPIVGNAVEHITAVTCAVKNKMDLAMGVAVGSCTQISLFVVPLTVLIGWAMDKPMTLNFPHFEIILFVLSVMTVSIVCANPTSNWLEGSLLISVYCMISIGFWFENVVDF